MAGEVRFVGSDHRLHTPGALTSSGLLAVVVPGPPWRSPSDLTDQRPSLRRGRGRLREAIEMAIEHALDTSGAPPPGVSDLGDLDQYLSDQLFRARSTGALGIELRLPDLTSAGNLAGALDAEDSAVLRWWIAATVDRPVTLLLDVANRLIGAYGPPTRLERLVSERETSRPSAPPALEMTSDTRPSTNETVSADLRESLTPPPMTAFVEGALSDDEDRAAPAALRAEIDVVKPSRAEKEPIQPEHAEPPAPLRVIESKPRLFGDRVVPLFPKRDPAQTSTVGSTKAEMPIDWRGFANELEVARGPKPLTIVERLFMSRYMPLLEALARGEADETARRTTESWAQSFARSYTEGFEALKVTGKRPRMVLDAPQVANQIARLHGAKSAQLVLVDGMRFDLGVRIHDRMRGALMSQATCTERLLLWSALPTTTPVQLELLARGPEGLANGRTAPAEREEHAVRGRSSTTLRRVKVGNRDLLKLDAVEARLREPGPSLGERLDATADEVAVVLATHARTLAPRTLMLVFGDHGFRMESNHEGTRGGVYGGASPEEVLVPAFAWLIGDVH